MPTDEQTSESTTTASSSTGGSTAGRTSHPVQGPVELRVDAGAGSVTVHATDTDACTVQVAPGDGSPRSREAAARTTVDVQGDRVLVDTPRGSGFLGRDGAVDIVVTLPTGSRLDLRSRTADVRATGVVAEAALSSGSGDARADEVTGAFRASTGSGDVALGRGGSAQVRAGSGTVRLGVVVGRLEVGTGSGDVVADEVGAEVLVASGSGDVRLGGTRGDVTVTTASGDVRLGGASCGAVAVKTASGDVDVAVPAGTAVLLDCSAVSGRLRSELAAAGEPGPDEPRLHLRVRTVSGDVAVHRA